MKKLFVLLVLLIGGFKGWSQEKTIDTAYLKNIVAGIDTLQSASGSIRHYIVRKYMHDGTTVNFEYLLDTVSWNFFRAASVTQTIYSRGDTSNTVVSFYLNQNRYIATKVDVKNNSQVTTSSLLYLEMAGDSLSILSMSKPAGSDLETNKELESKAKELWLWAASLKESLQKPKAANTGLPK